MHLEAVMDTWLPFRCEGLDHTLSNLHNVSELPLLVGNDVSNPPPRQILGKTCGRRTGGSPRAPCDRSHRQLTGIHARGGDGMVQRTTIYRK